MGKIKFNDKEVAKMSKKDFLKQFKAYDKYIDGGLENYYDKLKPKNQSVKKDSK